ncbi:MAG: hypothetical protein H7Y15_16375 [Pseudonocardia sp.]|nr:hypothetical protein [Pseudonocardia sp.]
MTTSPLIQPAPTGPVTYAPLPNGRQGVVVGGEQLTGTDNSRDTVGNTVIVQDQQTGQRFGSVQPTRVGNGDGTETVFIPRLSGNRVGYNPTGRTAAVYELPAGASGRIGAGTQVDQVRVRTQPGATLQFNGGGGSATPGMAFRDPVYGNPVEEEWTIFPASSLDYTTGVRRYSAQVPAGYEDRVDLAQSGTIRIRVPAGSRPVAVTRSVQAFTPYVPTPLPVLTPSLSDQPTYTPFEAPPARIDPTPMPRPTPTRPRPTQSTPAPSGNGLLQRAGDAWNDQPVTVRDLPDRTVEVAFPDARAVYDRNGNKLRGDANAPNRVNPLQIATPGQALDELGNIIQNIPPIPIPGWDPGGQYAF